MSPAGKAPFCPQCSKPATGNFCQNCGASLGGKFCNQCGEKMAAGASFCNQCGAKAGAAKAGAHRAAAAATVGGQNLAWWIAGLAMFGLILVVGFSMVRPEGPVPPNGSVGGVGAGAPASGAPDISQMTPLEAADRLFDRVMRSVSAGDSASAQAFMPMALAAYERAQPLDNDGMFHLALLQRTAGELDASLATAEAILANDPDHLLGLNSAAEAAVELGRNDLAGEFYRHLLDVYDAQVSRALPEYDGHQTIVVAAKANAEAFLGGG